MSHRVKRLLAGAVHRHFVEQLESRRLFTLLFVDSLGTSGSSGSAWGNTTTLTHALSIANPGDQIDVALGIYTPGATNSSTFTLKSGVTVLGGFLGGSTADASTRSASNVSVLSGALGGQTALHVVTTSGVDATAILDGFTISGGAATSAAPPTSGEGGGIFNNGGTPTIRNCIITGNTAKIGGGIFSQNTNGSPVAAMTVTNCLIFSNVATGGSLTGPPPVAGVMGGGIEIVGGNVTIDNCTFNTNLGGAVESDNPIGLVKLDNSILWNDAPTEIKTNSIPVIASNCDITGGYALGTSIINSNPNFTSSSNYQLASGSPCIDVGSNSYVPTGVTTDLNFSPRIVNTNVDLGAYESQTTVTAPALIYVDQNSTNSSNTFDGASWTTAYHDLQTAIGKSGNGTTIEVAQGIYLPTSTSNQSATFQLKNGVTIKGGYGGFLGIGGGTQDTQGAQTVLSGAIIGDPGLNNNGYSYHVVTSSGTDSTAVLSNFDIAFGSASGAGTNGDGGGLYNEAGSPTISKCNFDQNYATFGGGGIYNDGASTLAVSNCGFDDESTGAGGGAIFSSATINLTTCVFGAFNGHGNSAMNGGGLYIAGGTATLNNVEFLNNSATTNGGAIENLGAITLTNDIFDRNVAALGGAMDVSGGSASVVNCNFNGNTAGVTHTMGQGGAISNQLTASSTFIQCQFVGNTATGNAGDGGAVFSSGSSAHISLINCALTSDSAVDGGAVFNVASQVSIGNTILWNNSAIVQAPEIDSGTGTLTQTNNDTADPIFFHNPSSGADHTWGTSDDDYGDLRLQATSPGLDAGSNSVYTSATSSITDFSGRTRFVDFPGVGATSGAIIDAGPYEAKLAFTVTGESFNVNDNPPDVKFIFSGNVSPPFSTALTIYPVNADGSLDTADLVSAASATYNSGTTTVTFALPLSMTDRNYRAVLEPGSVLDSVGDVLLSPAAVDFFILPGDANQDRIVNTLDFNALATNFGQSGKNFSQGDFDYSGTVGSGDFDLLAARFGKTLAAPAAMALPLASSVSSASLFSDTNIDAVDPIDRVESVL